MARHFHKDVTSQKSAVFNLKFPVKGRALGLLSAAVLTLSFCLLFYASSAAAADNSDVNLSGYITRMMLALLVLGGAGYAAVKYVPGRFRTSAQGKLKMIGALPLGRDAVYIVQTGPEVVALFIGRSGSFVVGRWSLDEWEDYEASLP